MENEEKVKKTKKKTKFQLISNIIGYVIFSFIFIMVIIVTIQSFTGGTPNFFGYCYYYIETNSMDGDKEDSFSAKNVIISKLINEKDYSSINIGDIVTFKPNDSSLPSYVTTETHRIVGYYYTYNKITGDDTSKVTSYTEFYGKYEIYGITTQEQTYKRAEEVGLDDFEIVGVVTKGDNETTNPTHDKPIYFNQIISKFVKKSPTLTWLYGVLRTFWGFFLLVFLPLTALIVINIISTVLAHKKDRAEKQAIKEIEANSEKIAEEQRKKLEEDAIKEFLASKQKEESTDDLIDSLLNRSSEDK